MNFHVGEILLVAFNFVPTGFYACNGQTLLVSQHSSLFSVIGSTYGGDGISTFALPNLTAPTDLYYIICEDGVYPPRP